VKKKEIKFICPNGLVSLPYLKKYAPVELQKVIEIAKNNDPSYIENYWERRYKECNESHLPGDCPLCGAV